MKVCIACGTKFNREDWECPSCNISPKIIGDHLAFSPELVRTSNAFKESYFEQLSSIEERTFWFRPRNRLIIWALQRYFPKAKNFLELGCGTGFVLSGIEKAFPNLTLYGAEIFIAGLDYATKRLSRVELFQMDARKIPFEDEFDLIGVFDVLEHLEDDERVLRNMYQAVRQSGGIILTVPQHPFLWSQIDEYACHVRRYRARELKAKVEHAGFEVIKMTSFISILLPLMIVSRLKKKQPAQGFDSMSEFRICRLINIMFEKVIDVERMVIRSGLSLPAGGSLLLIARKVPGCVS